MTEKINDTEKDKLIGLVKSKMSFLNSIEEEFKKNNFPQLSWYHVLHELEKSEAGSLRLKELGERVLLNKYNTSRLIARMEKENLVSRESCPVDGRGIFACITEEGRELRKKMWPVYQKVLKEKFESNSDSREYNILKEYKTDLPN